MVISKIIGGLGNQFFQYALGYALSKIREDELYLDLSEFSNYELRSFRLDNFHLQYKLLSPIQHQKISLLKIAPRLIRDQLFNTSFVKEASHSIFDYNMRTLYLDGYWQNPKYFEKFRSDLFNQIVPVKPLSKIAQKLLNDFNKNLSVSIHIRRGDYVSNPKANKHHGVLPISYYKKAIEYLETNIKKQKYFIFTDEAAWVKSNFTFINKPIFISDHLSNEIEELYLMSRCDHSIIANSTFSWWGAWLNQNTNKIVVSPKQWFKNSEKNRAQVLSKIGFEI